MGRVATDHSFFLPRMHGTHGMGAWLVSQRSIFFLATEARCTRNAFICRIQIFESLRLLNTHQRNLRYQRETTYAPVLCYKIDTVIPCT